MIIHPFVKQCVLYVNGQSSIIPTSEELTIAEQTILSFCVTHGKLAGHCANLSDWEMVNYHFRKIKQYDNQPRLTWEQLELAYQTGYNSTRKDY